MKKIIVLIMIFFAGQAYANVDPFNWNDNPVIIDDQIGGVSVSYIAGGLGASWAADPNAHFGYRIKVFDANKYQVFHTPTYENSLKITGLSPHKIYTFEIYRIETENPDDDVLIAKGSEYFYARSSKTFYCFIGGGWEVAVALMNKNNEPADVRLHIGSTVQTVIIPAEGTVAGMIGGTEFGNVQMSGRFIVWLEPQPGCFLFRVQFNEIGGTEYEETSE